MMPRSGFLACVLAGVLVAPRTGAAAPASAISFQDFSVEAVDPASTITLAPIGKRSALHVAGGDIGVRLVADVVGATRMSFAVQYVEPATHSFRIDYGGVIPEVTLTHVKQSPPRAWGGKLTMARGSDGSATFAPAFRSTERYSVRVTRDGVLQEDVSGRTGATTIASYERTVESGAESLAISFEYGRRRADAWTIVLVEEGFVVELTPEVTQPANALPEVTLRTPRLAAVDIIGPGHDGSRRAPLAKGELGGAEGSLR